MGHIRTDIHQVRNALTALPLGITLKQFAQLEEKHDKHRLWKFRLSTWQEADAEGADSSYGHQEMLVEGIAFQEALQRFLQCVVTYQQVRYQINQQQLPRG